MRFCISIALLVLLMGFSAPANSALIDRGTGMIYDSDQGITWLQDANYAYTSGYWGNNISYGWSTIPGGMNWHDAMAWSDQLVYGGFDDWRLPRSVDGPFEHGLDGTTTAGYGITSSEMGYMYYENLGNLALVDANGNWPQPGWGLQNTGPFYNIETSSGWWSSTEASWGENNAFTFYFAGGDQHGAHKDEEPIHAWAVRDGDYGPSVNESNPYETQLLLGTEISFDYWWEMGTDPPAYEQGLMWDVLALQGGAGWQFIGQINAYQSSTDWQTVVLVVPEEFRGMESQIRFVLSDYYPDTNPTVYLNNIASNTAPVPEPATILLLGTSLVGLAGFRRKKFFKK